MASHSAAVPWVRDSDSLTSQPLTGKLPGQRLELISTDNAGLLAGCSLRMPLAVWPQT